MTSVYLQNFVNFSIIETASVWKNTIVVKKTTIQYSDISLTLSVKLAIRLMKVSTLRIKLILQSQYASSVVLCFISFGRTKNY